MRREQKLTREQEFAAVYREGRSWGGRLLVLRARPNGLELSRFGFVVSKRVGKAVVRNRVKRRLREIVRTLPVVAGWDLVLVARAPAAESDYPSLEAEMRRLLRRARLLEESARPGVTEVR